MRIVQIEFLFFGSSSVDLDAPGRIQYIERFRFFLRIPII